MIPWPCTAGGPHAPVGFLGEETVLFDDFEGEIPLPVILRLTDGYPERVPFKGGYRWYHPKQVIFTSNMEWKSWWPSCTQEHRDAFARRITKVVHYEKPKVPDMFRDREASAEKRQRVSAAVSSADAEAQAAPDEIVLAEQ